MAERREDIQSEACRVYTFSIARSKDFQRERDVRRRLESMKTGWPSEFPHIKKNEEQPQKGK
jgi:hypothetical protein